MENKPKQDDKNSSYSDEDLSYMNEDATSENPEENIKIPDFYEIDFYDYESRKNQDEDENEDENQINSDPKKNEEEEKLFAKKLKSGTEFFSYFDKLKITRLEFYQFSIDNQLYQHRDVVFLGKIQTKESNPVQAFIKCFNMNNLTEMNEIIREVDIYMTLYQENKKFFCKILAYYFDTQNSSFYLFYQYFKRQLLDIIINLDLTKKIKNISSASSEDESSSGGPSLITTNIKMEIFKQLVEFLVLLHTKGTIHRDL